MYTSATHTPRLDLDLVFSQVSSNEVLSRCKKVAYILAFTSTIPLGIAVGVGLQNAPSANREIVSAVLEAFATGESTSVGY